MAESPLELYEKAYRFHYVEQAQAQARQLYEAIVREFPESNEAGYSVIQLQKMTAEGVSVTALPQAKVVSGPLLLAAVILNFVTLLMIIIALVTVLSRGKAVGSISPGRTVATEAVALPSTSTGPVVSSSAETDRGSAVLADSLAAAQKKKS